MDTKKPTRGLSLLNYQTAARKTAIYPEEYKIIYPTLGLCGESGEVAEKIKKILRDCNGKFTDEHKEILAKEIGDCGWYISNLCSDLGLSLEDVFQMNLDKLKSRQERGKLQGSGDNR